MPLQDDYRVRLNAFEGPLDLLLYLVRRHEVDIADIPIHLLTEQYLEFLRGIDRIDIELAGEFLVMAATLIEIKSRTLAPRPEGSDADGSVRAVDDPSDPRHDLIRQLIDYQKFRGAAVDLDRLRRERAMRSEVSGAALREPAPAAGEDAEGTDGENDAAAEAPLDLEDVHVLDLLRAYERIIAAVDFTRLGEHRVEYDDTPIALYEADIIDQLSHSDGRRLAFTEVFRGRKRGEIIGLFLALLELVRTQRIRVEQARPEDPLRLELAETPA